MRGRKQKAFSLIELVVSIGIMLILTPFFISTIKITVDRFAADTDQLKAHKRISRTESLLKAPLFYCGLGMPADAPGYKAAFGSQKYDPFRWDGPISVKTGQSGFDNSELRVSYVRPGSAKLTSMTLSETPDGVVKLHKFPDENEIGDRYTNISSDIRNWVFFPTSFPPSTPFCVTGLSGKTMCVRNNMERSFSISRGDKVHHMRAMCVYSLNDCLYTKDFRAPGAQPRIKGILDIRFDLDKEKRLIKVYILARGDRLYDSSAEIEGREEWPEEYIRQWEEKGSKYKLFASKSVWFLPNLIGSDLICEEYINTTELF
ncbi:MAG: type II secretion system GspH family protein [Synergistaceae bacterium]|jgi:type II secretory pathway pseudopilin PulG|nr:type II secretion system GspH family protein [Synergistaceae bacterium]